jgi:periplasmic copper chaperone A
MHLLKIAAALILFTTAAHAQSKPVVIEDAWVRVYNGTVSAFFHILNNGEEPDRLLAVTTPVADKAQLLRTRTTGSRYTYVPLESLEIGGFEDPRLRPGGIHVQLTGLTRELRVGDAVPLTLRFARSGTIEVTAHVSNQLLGNR